ncbi:MAG: MBOAT family protein [Oscillospiraceae bacterium]|nr:MBOAT family protein [Oscillospiraceae bacterium]
MVFSSLLFLFAFLPLNLLLYYAMPSIKAKNVVMLLFSLVFYAWAGPIYVLLLVFMTFADWLLCVQMDRSGRSYGQRKALLITALVVDLGLLGVFKYLTFLLSNTQLVLGWPEQVPEIVLPIGISFYTFQLVSYVVDVYRREVRAQDSFWKLLLYVSLFHQCIAGPIVRYQHVADEIDWRHARLSDIADGAGRFAVGLAKKAMLANPCGNLADSFLGSSALAGAEGISFLSQRSALALWLGVIAYTLQIYLDFSAYSDMAIGMGRMVGFHYRENFDFPYISKSVTEFWRRWHMSLSSFFRDYIYIPLGGSRCSKLCNFRNLAIVWLLTGLWHGASWNFVLWGAYYLLFLAFEKFVLGKALDQIPSLIRRCYLLLVVTLGWLMFRLTDLDCLGSAFSGLFCLNGNPVTDLETTVLLKSNFIFMLAAILACTPLVRNLYRRVCSAISGLPVLQGVWTFLQCAVPILLLLLSTAALVGDQYNPFLYFRF